MINVIEDDKYSFIDFNSSNKSSENAFDSIEKLSNQLVYTLGFL